MKKKVLMSFVLLAIIGTSAVFAQQATLDKLRFQDTSYGTTTNGSSVSAANNSISGAVVIPETAPNGKAVIVIGQNAFQNITGITSVTIPNSVMQIGTNAFRGCTGLTSITIPASVTDLRSNPFTDCTNLTSITFLGANATTRTSTIGSQLPGDLRAKYLAGGAGTYTRQRGSDTWTKQAGVAICPTCGQPMP